MSFRAAVIGCGKIGSEFAVDPRMKSIHTHAGAYAACPKTALVAICDIDPVKLARCGERWNVAARYSDARELLEAEKPQIVSVCTPDNTHYELICAILETPGVRAILAEKPLAMSLEQANAIVDLANRSRVVLAVNYSRRYAKDYLSLKEMIRSGQIGKVQTIGGYYSKGTLHNGTHWFDLARFLIGEITRVWGFDTLKEGGDDPTFDAVLEFDDGINAHLQGCQAAAFSLFEMDLIGTHGRIRIVESGQAFEIYEVAESPYYSGYRVLVLTHRVEGGMQDVLLHAVEDIVHCLTTGSEPRCSGADGVAALDIGHAVRESARTKRPVTLSR